MHQWLVQLNNRLGLRGWLSEVWMIFWSLIKIMVPILLLVRFIELMGWIEELAVMIQPLMAWTGLPGDMGLVWMSAMVSNIYTGMAVFYQLGGAESLTVAQVSVLGTMILIAHAIPMEAGIAKATGISLCFTLLLRIGGALILGGLLNLIYSHYWLLQTPVPVLWQPEIINSSWQAWFYAQINMLLAALLIIAGLTLCIRILRFLGIEKLVHVCIAPVLKAIGIGTKASNIMIVGLTLGLSFGGGLLIQEARSGKLSGKDIFLAMAFLGLCHSIIEDTLLILLLGADIYAVLWARLLFALITIALFARLLIWLPEKQHKWLYRTAP